MNRNKISDTLVRRSTTNRRIQNPGVKKLRRAADTLVGKSSGPITRALKKESLNGNASCTRLLFQLADGADWVNDEKAVSKVLGIAETWKNEPEWTPPAQGQAATPLDNQKPLEPIGAKPAGK